MSPARGERVGIALMIIVLGASTGSFGSIASGFGRFALQMALGAGVGSGRRPGAAVADATRRARSLGLT